MVKRRSLSRGQEIVSGKVVFCGLIFITNEEDTQGEEEGGGEVGVGQRSKRCLLCAPDYRK